MANSTSNKSYKSTYKPSEINDVTTTSASCASDLEAVVSLPDDWEPKRGGIILQTYLKDRVINHNSLVAEMTIEASQLNKDIDSSVRILAENLLEHVKDYEVQMNQLVHNCNHQSNVEIGKELNAIHVKYKQDIITFRHEMLVLERKRSEFLKNLLRKYFQRLITIGYYAPRELLHIFDGYFLEANQQMLSNNRSYIDLEVNLLYNAQLCYIHFKSVLSRITFKSKTLQQRRSRSAKPLPNDTNLPRQRSLSDTRLSRSSQLLQEKSHDKFYVRIEEFDECISRLLEIYRSAVTKVFCGFSCKLDTLHEDFDRSCCIESTVHMPELSELELMINRAIRHLSENFGEKFDVSSELLKQVQHDGMDLQKSLDILGDRLRETYFILHESVHLWDPHMIRLGLAQKLTLAAVEDLVTSNDALELANEVSFNIALEQLRQCTEVDKLKVQYDSILQQLHYIENMYIRHKDSELQKLEELFLRLLSVMSLTMLAELDYFLDKNPRTSVDSKINFSSSMSPRYTSILVSNQLTRSLLQTELQSIALLNWKNGFLECLENNRTHIPDQLQSQARQWVEGRSSTLHMRYALKKVAHAVRAERVCAVFNLRNTELQYHEKRLVDHTEAIDELLEDVGKEVSGCLSLGSRQLYPIIRWVNDIEKRIADLTSDSNINFEIKTQKIISYSMRLTKHRDYFEESIAPAIDEVSQRVQQRIQEARVANLRFLSHIYMFFEGGRYGAKEADRATNILVKAAQSLETLSVHYLELLRQKRTHLLSLADDLIATLQNTIEEYLPKRDKKNQMQKRK